MINSTNKVISVSGKKTSMRLSNIEWKILDKICVLEHLSRHDMLQLIYKKKDERQQFTPAVRTFLLVYLYNYLNKPKAISYNLRKAFNEIQ